jgi:YebC/PmpR family DNA-binding regulatory protein
MSGHSKWKTIKHQKAAKDAKKSKIFTKLIKEITVAARVGGGDINHNATLRSLLEKAREHNMPSDNALRAVKKGTGELPGVHYESYQYEGYGPAGVAIIIDVLTDNKNRAISDIRNLFTRRGGVIAENGAVSWMFDRCGVVRGTAPHLNEDKLLEELLEFDIKAINQADDAWYITCDPRDLEKVKEKLKTLDFTIDEAELELVPKTPVHIAENQEQQVFDFLENLEELDDVQNVHTNLA